MRRILDANRQRERARQEAMQIRLAARFERAMRSEIAGAMREILQGFEATRQINEARAHEKAVRDILQRDVRASVEMASQRISEAMKGTGPKWMKAEGEDLFERIQQQYMENFGAEKVVQISKTTRDQMSALLKRFRDEGYSVDKIAREMRKEIPTLSRTRAHVIARTETHSAANFASTETAKETGVEMQKEWISANDGRERATHDAADGQIVGMNASFRVGGASLNYPGDPSGPADETIMCRCAQGFVVAD